MRDKDKLVIGKALALGSVACVLLALFGAMGTDLWLASTQWLLVGLVLGVWGVFVLLEAQFRLRR